jgi:hypothetical protein
MGIAYVRNYILDLNDGMFGVLDDDITAFGFSNNGKCIKENGILLSFIENCEKNSGFAGYTMLYQQFAWCKKQEKKYTLSASPEVASVFNKKLIGNARYREDVYPEDRDFTIQLLMQGGKTIQFIHYWFSCPKCQSNKGGLYGYSLRFT